MYICGAAYLGFTFPGRKWWDFQKRERILEFVIQDVFGEAGFLLRVRIEEYRTGSFVLQTDEYRRDEIRQAFLHRILKNRHYDALFVMDWDGDGLVRLLPKLVEDKNYLAVLTSRPEVYEEVMESIAMEYGLIGTVFSDYRDFAWYQRQVCVNRHALILWENAPKHEDLNGKNIFYRFGEGDFLVDFSVKQDCRPMYWRKRMDAEYVNMPIFLDNMVKNRYNSLVNEGLLPKGHEPDTEQNVYRSDHESKLTEIRKGIRKWKKRKLF